MNYLLVESSAGRLSAKSFETYEKAKTEFSSMEPYFDGFVGVWEVGVYSSDLTESTSLLYKKI